MQRTAVSRWLGRLCVPLLSRSYVARFVDDYYVDQEPKGLLRRAIRAELTRRFYARSDAERRADNRAMFWGGNAALKWHERRQRRYSDRSLFEGEYLASRARLLEQLDLLIDRRPDIASVCEIGTGSGLFIEHLSERLAGVRRFCAIDLNAEQIARNRRRYAGSRVEYLHAEVLDYVERLCRPGTLFVASGTFECFTQPELEELLDLARAAVPGVAFAMCDAVDVDFDARTERESRPRGELLYNHNYRHLFESSGYRVEYYDLDHCKPIYDRATLVASADGTSPP